MAEAFRSRRRAEGSPYVALLTREEEDMADQVYWNDLNEGDELPTVVKKATS